MPVCDIVDPRFWMTKDARMGRPAVVAWKLVPKSTANARPVTWPSLSEMNLPVIPAQRQSARARAEQQELRRRGAVGRVVRGYGDLPGRRPGREQHERRERPREGSGNASHWQTPPALLREVDEGETPDFRLPVG